jgi:hypothetical protein
VKTEESRHVVPVDNVRAVSSDEKETAWKSQPRSNMT